MPGENPWGKHANCTQKGPSKDSNQGFLAVRLRMLNTPVEHEKNILTQMQVMTQMEKKKRGDRADDL